MAAVNELPEAQREAFLLKEEADLGFQEIADVAGCSRDTAKSRFRLAVEKLRAALSAEGLGPGGNSHA
jgi:RNA polymerase sigma-70 factor (ECF subfamily)